MKRFLFAVLLLAPYGAFAQSVQQSGVTTPGHLSRWISNGIIGDGGTASDSAVTSIGVTSNSAAGFCVASGRATAAGRQQLCFGAPLASAAVISLQNYGTATAQNLTFVINGTTITLPTGGTGFVQYTGALTSGDLPCFSGTSGLVADCGYAIAAGAANKIAYWASATSLTSIAAAASSVLVTSAGSIPSLSQTLPSAVQANITGLGTIASGTWNGSVIGAAFGGTGAATLTAHGVLIGEGTGPIASVTSATVGQCLLSQGLGTDPIFASCASGSGTAGGSTTQVQFNNATNLAGSANLTWVTPALTIGVNAAATGQLVLANGGALGVSVTIQNLAATTAYNFNLPTGAGASGQPLLSGGGASTSMSFGTLSVAGGGTACSAAAGICLDNITNFSSTGYINRTGSGTYAFSTVIPLSGGGTNAALTASNGGIFYSTATAGAILSATATANQILMSGSSAAPAWSTATYPATTTVNQILYSSSTNVIAGLATGNSGVLITSAGGVPSISSTLPTAVQDNITRVGTINNGVWSATVVSLAFGGTNNNLTASNGGIFYSTATAGAILSGTATASFPLLSGSTAAPTWATITYPSSATSGGIPYFSSTTAIASSGLLGANALMIGGGAGAAPSTISCGTSTTVVHGGTPPTCSQIVAADITTNTVSNANLAQMAAVTLQGNPTNATANASAFTLAGLVSRGAPDASNDLLLIWDSAAGTLKKVTPGAVASSATAGVSSIAGNTGAFTLANGIDNSTNQIQLTAARRTLPTVSKCITSGTGCTNGGFGGAGTYTTPANVLWIEIEMVGAGGGGAGSGTTPGATGSGVATCWNTSGAACSAAVYSAGGGQGASASTAGVGGVVSGGATCNIALSGGGGGDGGGVAFIAGGSGGSTVYGGAGRSGAVGPSAGYAATANTGAGGGGASDGATVASGGGGGAGAYCRVIINSPAATYTYTVGALGAGGTLGTSGAAGGNGAVGAIYVTEHYGS